MSSKVEYLVVDTSAFIKNAQVQEIADVIITIDDVLNEIKSSRQLKRLVVLPYDLQIKSVEAESISIVTKFAKKTGDYPALSATDIKVLALTYQLEKEHVGTEHLRSEPVAPKSVEPIEPNEIKPGDIVGFYSPDGDSEDDDDKENETNSNDSDEEKKLEDVDESEESESEGDDDSAQEELEGEQEVPEVDSDLILRLKDMSCNETITDCDQNDPCALDDDEAGWITPGNLKESKRGIYGGTLEEKSVKVACLTTDFAMQNVLKQMGLNMVSLDGLVIKEVRTFILRCYSCFKTTPIMTKLFCSHCGNKTLKRVSVTVDEEGKEHIHINFRRPLTGKGKKFPLPKFQGGKHSSNPILSEDQRVPQQRLTRIARQKNNPMDDDYIAGVSPFLMRDVSSKSAILGVQRKVEVKSWMRRNPNEVAKKRRKR